MTYSDLNAVSARGGAAMAGLSGSSTPTQSQVMSWLQEASNEVDAALTGHGIPLPPSDAVRKSVAGPVADYALALALRARYPSGAPGVSPLIEQSEARWKETLDALVAGTHPAIAAHEAVDAAADAISFWDDKSPYTHLPDRLDETVHNPNLEPDIYRGMSL